MATRKPKRTSYHHGDLREALLSAAVELIAEHGPDGFTLREAARRLGVSHSAPYRHFADKDALLIAVAEAGFAELYRRGREAIDASPGRGRAGSCEDPRAGLLAFGRAYLEFAADHPSQYRVMFGRTIAKPTAALREAGDLAFGLLEAQVAAVVGHVEVRGLAMAVWSGVHGLAMLAIDGMLDPGEDGGRTRLVELGELTVRLLDAGLVSLAGDGPRGPASA